MLPIEKSSHLFVIFSQSCFWGCILLDQSAISAISRLFSLLDSYLLVVFPEFINLPLQSKNFSVTQPRTIKAINLFFLSLQLVQAQAL